MDLQCECATVSIGFLFCFVFYLHLGRGMIIGVREGWVKLCFSPDQENEVFENLGSPFLPMQSHKETDSGLRLPWEEIGSGLSTIPKTFH